MTSQTIPKFCMSRNAKRKLFERDNWTCTYCGVRCEDTKSGGGQRRWASVDHKIPLTRGGKGGDNLTTACWSCNCQKRNKTHDEYVEWRLVRLDWEETRL